MRIVVDPPKRIANLEKHGLDLNAVGYAFFEEAVILEAKKDRFLALGRLDGRTVAAVFKPLGTEAIALISLRPASKQERTLL